MDIATVRLFLRIIDGDDIVLRLCLVDAALGKEGEHLLRRHLIVAFLHGQLLDGEGIADDMRVVDDRVFHKHL